jgi:hypothetical protein
LLIPFIMFGGYHLVHRNAGNGWFIVGWVLLLPFLAYAPYNLQRRLPEGIWVAFVVLGLVGIYTLQSKFLDIKSRLLRFLLTKADSIAVGLLLPSTIILLIGGILSVLKPREPLFIPSEQAAAFDFLSMNAFPGEIVLASYPTSNALPAWAPIRVVAGHGPETIDLAELIPQVTRIFQSRTSDAERIHFLTTQAVGYIIWGPEERSLGDWNPERAVYLQRIYQSEHYSVYQVDLTGF